jgi:hypothetical protein
MDLGENFTSGFRIATGQNGSPVSENQTLGNPQTTGVNAQGGNFSGYAIWLDRAFLKYEVGDDPDRLAALTVGRFDNPFFTPTTIMWANDIGFDGIAAQARSALQFVLEPEDQSVFKNEGLLLRVGAAASTAVSYQWNICSPDGKSMREIDGATGSELRYDHLKVGYNYFCVIARCGSSSLKSRVAKIAVLAAPAAVEPIPVRVETPPAAPPQKKKSSAKKTKGTPKPIIVLDDEHFVTTEKKSRKNPLKTIFMGSTAVVLCVVMILIIL